MTDDDEEEFGGGNGFAGTELFRTERGPNRMHCAALLSHHLESLPISTRVSLYTSRNLYLGRVSNVFRNLVLELRQSALYFLDKHDFLSSVVFQALAVGTPMMT
jgi:hypothetical protein